MSNATTTQKERSERIVFATHASMDPKTIWKLLGAFTDTVPVTITPDEGMFVQVLDRGCSSMCEWTTPPSAFETFDIEHTHHFGITVPVMIKIMSAAGSGATITWTLNTSGDECIHIVAVGGNGIDLTVMLRTCEIEQEIMEVPLLRWTRVCVSTGALQRTVARLKGLQSEMSNVCLNRIEDPPGVLVSVKSTLLSTASASVDAIETDTGDGDGTEGDGSGLDGISVSAHRYQATLLSSVLDGGTGICDRVWICWKEDRPLFIEFDDSTIDEEYATKIGNLKLYIAPLLSLVDEGTE